METVVQDSFRYASFVVDKRKLYSERFNSPTQVYEFSVGIVCEQVRPLLDNAKIIIDRNGNRDFKQRLEKSLKSQMTDKDGSCRIRKVGMESSRSNNLVQLADMICSAVGRSFTASEHKYRDRVRRNEKFVQLWPPTGGK